MLPSDDANGLPALPVDNPTTVSSPASNNNPLVPPMPTDNATAPAPAPSNNPPVVPPMPSDNSSVVPPMPANNNPVVPPMPTDQSTVIPPPPVNNPSVVSSPPSDNSTAVPAPPDNNSAVIPAPPSDNTTAVPPPPVNNAPAAPAIPADTTAAAPPSPANNPPAVPPMPSNVTAAAPPPVNNPPAVAPMPSNVIAPAPAFPANTVSAVPPSPGDYSTFKNAIWTGYAATRSKQWQVALIAFRAALPLAQTPKELNYTQHWVHYTCVQMGIPAVPVPPLQTTASAFPSARTPAPFMAAPANPPPAVAAPSTNPPPPPSLEANASTPPPPPGPAPSAKPAADGSPIELSALHAYKGLKWGSPLSTFVKLKKIKDMKDKGETAKGFGTDQTQLSMPIDLLLSNFKGTPEVSLLNVYLSKEDVYYLFYKNRFALVAGSLLNGNYAEILRQFKEKFKTIKNFDHTAQDGYGVNYKFTYSQFESSNGVSVYLIQNTRDYSGDTLVDTLFVYVPKDQLKEIQDQTLEKIKADEANGKKLQNPDLEKDIKKL